MIPGGGTALVAEGMLLLLLIRFLLLLSLARLLREFVSLFVSKAEKAADGGWWWSWRKEGELLQRSFSGHEIRRSMRIRHNNTVSARNYIVAVSGVKSKY